MTLNGPLVSVIIPNYRRTHELLRSISSVLAQTYENFEIVIVDDHSDNIAEISALVEQIRKTDGRVDMIVQERNEGGGAARNAGILKARGDYIAFLDSDDEWKPAKLQKQLEAIGFDRNDEVFVYCKAEIIYRKTPMYLPGTGIGVGETVSDYLFLNNGFIPTPSILVSRTLARRVMFNPKLRRHQDYDFIFRAGECEPRFIFVDDPLLVIHWEGERGYHKKGWSPDLTYNFARDYRKYFSSKAYNNFLFMNLINSSAVCYSKVYSLKMLRHVNLFEVKPVNLLKYLKNLLRVSYEA